MIKILKFLFIVQEISNRNRLKKLGRGFSTAIRLNPFNPLSYIVLISIPFVGILLFGFVGVWKEISFNNPFKWR